MASASVHWRGSRLSLWCTPGAVSEDAPWFPTIAKSEVRRELENALFDRN